MDRELVCKISVAVSDIQYEQHRKEEDDDVPDEGDAQFMSFYEFAPHVRSLADYRYIGAARCYSMT